MECVQRVPLRDFAEKFNAYPEPLTVTMYFDGDLPLPNISCSVECEKMTIQALPDSDLKKATMSFHGKNTGCLDIGEGGEYVDWLVDLGGFGAYYLETEHAVIEILMNDGKPFSFDEDEE